MKKTYILLIVLSMASIIGAVDAVACTSAIIAAKANPYGRPLLWKTEIPAKPTIKWNTWLQMPVNILTSPSSMPKTRILRRLGWG